MRLVFVSDTHGRHEELGILHGDVLIHCGDFCDGFRNDGLEIEAIDKWFAKQDFAKILCVGGNHDFAAQDRFAKGEEVFENAVFLQDSKIEFGGRTFYGAPWLPDLSGWAYYLADEERRHKWELIAPETDVLITHSPPWGILDRPRSGTSIGCPLLRSKVSEIQPKVHCFGHVHASAGQLFEGSTHFINASVIGSDHLVHHEPRSIDIRD